MYFLNKESEVIKKLIQSLLDAATLLQYRVTYSEDNILIENNGDKFIRLFFQNKFVKEENYKQYIHITFTVYNGKKRAHYGTGLREKLKVKNLKALMDLL